MQEIKQGFILIGTTVMLSVLISTGCQTTPTNTVTSTGTNSVNSNVNTNTNVTATTITTAEPERYQAAVKLTFELLGEGQKTAPPPLGAVVARNATDRYMEFTLPVTNEKVIYLDKGGMNYVILPGRKQYAELTKEALGFEVRRMMMPEQIVQQVKAIPGIRLVGEETVNGRPTVKYAYSGAANTQTQAGTVATESYVLIDKETSLPVRSETVSQSQGGANVQGLKGLRVLTEMSDIKTAPDANLFNVPTDYQKIDPEQVKAQATLIFNAIAALIGQAVQQAQTAAPAATASPAAAPAR